MGIAAVCVAVAVCIAVLVNRRDRPGPAIRSAAAVPAQLDRGDFPRPDVEILVVLFSSATCDGCRPMAEKVAGLESATVATAEIEYRRHRALHERYAIDSVPLVVIADGAGVVRRHFLGAASVDDLDAALRDLRDSGRGSGEDRSS